jgi:DNA invertase Pin-like site-specific DNA recombinase
LRLYYVTIFAVHRVKDFDEKGASHLRIEPIHFVGVKAKSKSDAAARAWVAKIGVARRREFGKPNAPKFILRLQTSRRGSSTLARRRPISTMMPTVRIDRPLCANRGWSDVKKHVDVGFNGSKDSRPAWNECWDAIQKGRVNVLLVHSLDRLGRSLPHLVKTMATLTERNITLVSYRENIDLSTAAGRMLAGLFSVLADYELSIIRERTKAGLRAAKARGSQIGNRMRFFDKRKAAELP